MGHVYIRQGLVRGQRPPQPMHCRRAIWPQRGVKGDRQLPPAAAWRPCALRGVMLPAPRREPAHTDGCGGVVRPTAPRGQPSHGRSFCPVQSGWRRKSCSRAHGQLLGSRFSQIVIKTTRRRRLLRVCHLGEFGTLDRITRRLAAHGWQINTGFIERVNLTIRQHVAPMGGHAITLCKHEAVIRQQLPLYHVHDNSYPPHAALRQPWPEPEPTDGSGSAERWRPCMPAMVTELTARL
jgi:hypothetical protein